MTGTWRRVRRYLAYALAIGSVLSSFGAIAVLGFAASDGTGIVVQGAVFLAVPLLAVLALGIAYGADHVTRRSRWLPAALLTVGVALAGSAHMVWYRLVDASVQPAATPWILTVSAAIVVLTLAIAVMLTPTFVRSGMPLSGALCLALLTGGVAGVMFTVFLAMPFGASVLSVFALASVTVLHWQERRRTSQLIVSRMS